MTTLQHPPLELALTSTAAAAACSGLMAEYARVTSSGAAVSQMSDGGMVIVVDDEDHENEGDLVMAAEHVTPRS